ncbi:ATP synthase F1 subunit delta [Fontivita pretiosa]|uniref:ATP synthase F1 subunit delta n=1 Tax=Fontivita pretiosa TaxID=2989684 RepID=UPI003D17CA2A
MPKTIHRSPLAVAYATALLEVAAEQHTEQQVAQELSDLAQVIREDRVFALFLRDPAIARSEREQVLARVFGDQLSPLINNFLRVLNARGRLGLLPDVAEIYEDLLDERLGKIEVDVTVPQKLSGELLEEVRRRVSAALNKDAVVYQYVDDSIIGGLVLRVQDKLIDASVKAQLEMLKRRLLAAGATGK